MKRIGAKGQSANGKVRAKSSCADSRSTKSSQKTIALEVPVNLEGVDVIFLNSVRYTREGTVLVVTRVAPVKYSDEVFQEVDELIARGYGNMAAYEKVATKYGFRVESFGRQYRDRWANNPVRLSTGAKVSGSDLPNIGSDLPRNPKGHSLSLKP